MFQFLLKWNKKHALEARTSWILLACKLRKKTQPTQTKAKTPNITFCYFLSFTDMFVWKVFISIPPVFCGVKTKSKNILVVFYRKEIR